MDADRFDHLSRGFAAARPRRAALGFGLATVLGALGLAGADARPRCEACERRTKNGRCRRKQNGTTCLGKPCCECIDGRCSERPDDAPCDGDGRCLGGTGTCHPRPTCLAAGAGCPGDCCSGICQIKLNQATGVCAKAANGAHCFTGGDCQSGTCAAYRCR